MTNSRSVTFELADVLLTDLGGLDAFVRERRMRFQPVGWEVIAAEVVSVTATTPPTHGAGGRRS